MWAWYSYCYLLSYHIQQVVSFDCFPLLTFPLIYAPIDITLFPLIQRYIVLYFSVCDNNPYAPLFFSANYRCNSRSTKNHFIIDFSSSRELSVLLFSSWKIWKWNQHPIQLNFIWRLWSESLASLSNYLFLLSLHIKLSSKRFIVLIRTAPTIVAFKWGGNQIIWIVAVFSVA